MKNNSKRKQDNTTPRLSTASVAIRAGILSLGLAHGASYAATITVNSGDDILNTNIFPTCTLRKAVESINQRATKPGCVITDNAFGNNDTIEFAPELIGSTITLAGEELVISGDSTPVDLTLHGSNVTINADGKSRGFRLARDNALAIQDLTISNGSQSYGGGVFLEAGAGLIADNATFSNNQASIDGGAIGVFGFRDGEPKATVTLNNCTISGNRADSGGGVFISGGNANIVDSNISNNTVSSGSGGGGLRLRRGQFVLNRVTVDSNNHLTRDSVSGGGLNFSSRDASLEIVNSTISNNVVNDNGGGLSLYIVQGDSVTITNSTISSNIAGEQDDGNPNLTDGSGAGIELRGRGTLVLQNTTVFNNSLVLSSNGSTSANAAGVELAGYSSVQLVNSVIAGSVGGMDCIGGEQATATADRFNIIQDGSCATSALAVNPQLTSLADNGGTTKTHLPSADSAAINRGDNRNCQASDQRGELRRRTNSNRCDIGAVEIVEQGNFFVVPLNNGRAVIFEL